MQQRHPLSVLPQALVQAGYAPVGYRRAYEAALDARIPATRGTNGRWTFDPADLGTIAERLGAQLAHAGE